MFSENDLHHVELDTAFNIDFFTVAGTQGFRTESSGFDLTVAVLQLAELGIVVYFQEFSTVYDVRKVKIDDVVACNDIWVYFLDEIAPFGQECLLVLVAVDFSADDWSTTLESKDVSYKNFCFTVNLDDVSDLDNRVGLGCWELSSDSRALNVKTQNAEGCDLRELTFAREALNMVEI